MMVQRLVGAKEETDPCSLIGVLVVCVCVFACALSNQLAYFLVHFHILA
jgi:hypothetical protein